MHDDLPDAEECLSKGHKFDLKSSVFDKLSDIAFFDKKPKDGHKYVQILGLHSGKRSKKWIRSDYITGPDNFGKYKVFVPDSNGSGAIGEVLSTPMIGEPMIGSTQTFISIGSFNTLLEAENCMGYIKTKFARAMLGILKVTQHNPRSTWRYVPLQDFSKPWTDKELYKKYKLSDAEIKFIESMIKPMV